MANYIDYQTYLQSTEWKNKCKQVLIFWGNKCALCSSRNGIEIHHRTYERLGHELLTDLIPLCEICHERHHDYIDTGKPEAIKAVIGRVKRLLER